MRLRLRLRACTRMAVLAVCYGLLLLVMSQLRAGPLVAGLPGTCGDEWPLPGHVDPEIFQTIERVIEDKGFRVRSYNVTTADGYVLGMQRLLPAAAPAKRTPVLLMHGLLDSAFTWVSNLSNQSLAFVLSAAGYDVWLGNSRGNTYSRRHVRLSPSSEEFWKFSWDQMAEFDLPAMTEAVLANTGAGKIFYVGHSQGTETALAGWSSNRTLGSLVRAAALLAPVATVGHIESPIRFVAPLASTLSDAIELFGHGEFLPTSRLMKILSLAVCGDALSPLCSNIIFLTCGYDCKYMNMTRLPVYIGHAPAGTSAMNMVHYAQAIQSKNFQKYDFGEAENLRRYGQRTPPKYRLRNVAVPLALYHGKNDWLADPADFGILYANVSSVVMRNVSFDDYNHLDFVWAYNAVDRVYKDVVQFFDELEARQ